jgi:hypothetical protein
MGCIIHIDYLYLLSLRVFLLFQLALKEGLDLASNPPLTLNPLAFFPAPVFPKEINYTLELFTSQFSMFVDWVNDPIDSGVVSNGFVSGVNKDDFEEFVGGVLGNPV